MAVRDKKIKLIKFTTLSILTIDRINKHSALKHKSKHHKYQCSHIYVYIIQTIDVYEFKSEIKSIYTNMKMKFISIVVFYYEIYI